MQQILPSFYQMFTVQYQQIKIMSARLQSLSEKLIKPQNRLVQWRKKYPLCRKQLRNMLYTQKYSQYVDALFDVIISHPNIFKHENLQDWNRSQERLSAVQQVLTMHKLRPFQSRNYISDPHVMSIISHAIYHYDPGFCVKCDISFWLYGKTVYNFASSNPIQQKMAKEALSFEHIGCFGLTELGHGSNVKGIQTQAIYDHEKKQFIIHSPRVESMKFWIGAAAQLATMSVIWAQLIIDGVQYGPQPFLVPIRDPKTHEVYPGVTIGDCGHKNGANNIDNGYLMFNNYRIPKDYGLDRISGVDENGKFFYKTKKPQKLFGMYMGPLSMGRAFIVLNSIVSANSCLAIAIRYACTRRQFSTSPGKTEQLLIDYPTMRFRIMPLLAQNFVYFFGGINLVRTYDENLKQLLDPHNKLIEQLHAITGPCKAKSSWYASRVITQCREICGGHGYSALSGISRIYHGQDVNTTWEGDNNMLLQQTTKYILKTANKLSRGKTFQNNTLGFLSESIDVDENPSPEQLENLDYLQKIIKVRIRDLSQECLSQMIEDKSGGKQATDIWNQAQTYFGNALATSYGDLYYLEYMKKVIPHFQPAWKEVAQNCTKLWMFNLLLEWRWGSVDTRKVIQQKIVELVEWLAPRSVSIIDSLAAPSQVIGSVFADQAGEGMKNYVTRLFTGKKVFQRVPWYSKVIQLRNTA